MVQTSPECPPHQSELDPDRRAERAFRVGDFLRTADDESPSPAEPRRYAPKVRIETPPPNTKENRAMNPTARRSAGIKPDPEYGLSTRERQ